jgi:CRP-like cAMP-binding protein
VPTLEAESVFGEVSVLCGIPQPSSVRVTELCKLLRIDKDSFVNIMEIYFKDGRQVLNNLLKVFNLVSWLQFSSIRNKMFFLDNLFPELY